MYPESFVVKSKTTLNIRLTNLFWIVDVFPACNTQLVHAYFTCFETIGDVIGPNSD